MHRTIKPIRLGNLVGNRFKIKISGTDGDKKKINDILSQLNGGFPNYFGIQRFGAARPTRIQSLFKAKGYKIKRWFHTEFILNRWGHLDSQ